MRRQPFHLGQHSHLITEIETSGWLIHNNGGSILCQRSSDERKLALATADARVFGVRKLADTKRRQGAKSATPIFVRWSGEQTEVRRSTHHHHVNHAKWKMCRVRLGNVSDPTRDLRARELGHGHAIDQDLAPLRRQEAKDRLKECGLA